MSTNSRLAGIPMQVRQLLYAICTPNGLPPMVWGWPGQAKSAIMPQLAKRRGADLVMQRFNDKLPEDIGGTPMVVGDEVRRFPVWWVRQIMRAAAEGRHVILGLDEMTTCRQDVQAPLLALFLDKVAGDEQLDRERVSIVGIANPVELAANGTEIAHAFNNRVDHVDWAPMPHGMWVDYQMTGHSIIEDLPDFDPSTHDEHLQTARAHVCAFINARPSFLSQDPLRAEGQAHGQFASPRTVEGFMRKYATLRAFGDDDTNTLLTAATGLVGEAFAIEFTTWLRDVDLPAGIDVLRGKVKLVLRDEAETDSNGALKPGQYLLDESRPDRTYAILCACAAAVPTKDEKEFAKLWEACWTNALAKCQKFGKDQVVVAARMLAQNRPRGAVLRPEVQKIISAMSNVVREAGLMTNLR